LYQAFTLTPGRSGNGKRRRLLLESRREPWSRVEREAHALLVDEGITGWVANYPIWRFGVPYCIDVAFPDAMLAIEIDGWEFHGAAAFERDRWRKRSGGQRVAGPAADLGHDHQLSAPGARPDCGTTGRLTLTINHQIHHWGARHTGGFGCRWKCGGR